MCFLFFFRGEAGGGVVVAKIGYYCTKVELERRMQTAQSIPVRYGPTSELTRTSNSEIYRRFEEDEDDEDSLPEGE